MVADIVKVAVYVVVWAVVFMTLKRYIRITHDKGYMEGYSDAMSRVQDKLDEMERRTVYPELYKED